MRSQTCAWMIEIGVEDAVEWCTVRAHWGRCITYSSERVNGRLNLSWQRWFHGVKECSFAEVRPCRVFKV